MIHFGRIFQTILNIINTLFVLKYKTHKFLTVVNILNFHQTYGVKH